jgi:hypothetical protein
MAGTMTGTGSGRVVVGFQCGGPRPDECCDESFPGLLGLFSYIACRLECLAAMTGGSTFCCAECTVLYKDVEQPVEDKPTPAIDRNFPQIIALDGQFNFTNSAYGVVLPIVFGSDKLPGNVFWSSGFKNNTFTQADKVYTYTTVSFAVGICEGPINAVLRMWLGDRLIMDNTANIDADGIMQPNADGFVLGATVDLTSEDSPLRSLGAGARSTKITVYDGSETQLPDPLMISVEGYDATPAYRGVAYVLFENFICSESSIPALSMEVVSNANPIAPRLYGSLGSTPSPFDRPDSPAPILCTYDPSYNTYYMSAALDADNNFRGIAAFDGNKLDYIGGTELRTRLGFPWNSPTTGQISLLPLSGNFFLRWNDTGGSRCAIFNPFAGEVVSTMEPHTITHGITTGNGPNGYASLNKGACTFAYPGKNGILTDIYCGIGGTGRDIAFTQIGSDGRMTRLSNIPDPGLISQWTAMVAMQIGPANAEAHPVFFDGGSTAGTHIWIFNYGTDEQDGIRLFRISLADGGVLAPTISPQLTMISNTNFSGIGKAHNVDFAFVDPVDFGIVFYVTSTQDWLAKFDPFTGTIVWKIATHFPDGAQAQEAPIANLTGQRWAFVDYNSASIYSVDLKDGTETLVGTLSEHLLPGLASSARNQYFNGADNSITYLSGNTNRDMVRVYLDRTSRASVPVSDIVKKLLRRVGVPIESINVSDFTALSLRGYTISEIKSLSTIFSELRQVFTFDVIESNGTILFKTRGDLPIRTITHKALSSNEESDWLMQRRENTFSPTRKLNLTYRDLDRDYKQNVQSVHLPKYTGSRFDDDVAVDITVPVVLVADEAKRLAEILLYAKTVSETTYEGRLPPRHMDLDPGDVVNFEMPTGDLVTVRMRDVRIGNDRTLEVSAVSEDPDIYNDQTALFGNTGRYGKSEIPPPAPRVDPVILNIPWRAPSEAVYSSYNMFVTFLNRRTNILPSTDNIVARLNGSENILIEPPTNYPTWGVVTNPLRFIPYYYATDYESTLRIRLMNDTGAALSSAASKDAMLANSGVNLAYVGGELIQFETVTNEGSGIYALRGIHRAKFGTENAVARHVAGEDFILLADALGVFDEGGVRRMSVPLGESPRKAAQIFMNTGNPQQPNPTSIFFGLNTRPWSPSGYYAERNAGDVIIHWHRRSRFDGEWIDDGDFETVPLNASEERYELYLYTDPTTFAESDPLTYLRKVDLTSEEYTYTAADQSADGYDQDTDYLFVSVRQVGAYNPPDIGPPAIFYLDPRT